MNKAIIIAEIGECFNGDFKKAKRLISVAKDSGCDMAKFQTLDYDNIRDDDPEKEWFRKIALNPEKIRYLIKYSREVGIPILFSPENIKTASWLLDFNLEDIKIPSSLITELDFINFVNLNFKRVFVSTGMASLKEVKQAVKRLSKVRNLYIMHCISEYPTGPLIRLRGLKALSHEDVRLNMMKMLMELFPQYKVGYSDHTCGIIAPLAAVAMGARVIEKHITLDRETPIKNYKNNKEYLGTDHVLSLEPGELREMVEQIREVEKILGEWKWKRSQGEKILREFQRKRFVVKRH
jgi:N,N'-diacetyllegionaminate synthase